MSANILFIRDDKWFIAQSLETDVASQGRSLPTALRNLAEALELHRDQSHLPSQDRHART